MNQQDIGTFENYTPNLNCNGKCEECSVSRGCSKNKWIVFGVKKDGESIANSKS